LTSRFVLDLGKCSAPSPTAVRLCPALAGCFGCSRHIREGATKIPARRVPTKRGLDSIHRPLPSPF
jgi:hypothetical protein